MISVNFLWGPFFSIKYALFLAFVFVYFFLLPFFTIFYNSVQLNIILSQINLFFLLLTHKELSLGFGVFFKSGNSLFKIVFFGAIFFMLVASAILNGGVDRLLFYFSFVPIYFSFVGIFLRFPGLFWLGLVFKVLSVTVVCCFFILSFWVVGDRDSFY